MFLINFGDAMEETKQVAPGTRPDAIYGFGLVGGGSPDSDVDMARLLLTKEPRPESQSGVRVSE